MTDFKDFIAGLLQKYGRVKESMIPLFTDEESMRKYIQAFTHKTYSTNVSENYEMFEFRGDTKVNDATVEHIAERFPRIVSVKWMTRIKHNLISKKTLGLLAENAGFFKHIRYGEEMTTSMTRIPELHSNKDYMSMMEDVFEAFVGCTYDVVRSKKRRGTAAEITANIVDAFLSTIAIPIEYEDVFDAKSRLKELYDRHGWLFSEKNRGTIYTEEIKPPRDTGGRIEYFTTIYGFPRGPTNRERLVSRAKGLNKSESQQLASQLALDELATKYGIHAIRHSAYEHV